MKTCLLLLALFASLPAASLELVSLHRIWDQAPHSAFGDIIRFRERFFCVFREGLGHAAKPGQEDDGKLRVIASQDGNQWRSEALITEPGIDLRDPHFSITPANQLMIVAGGSRYPKGVYQGRQSRVFFSKNGSKWTHPLAVLEEGHWLWRVTWHKDRAWGVSKYSALGKEITAESRRTRLVSSADGLEWKTISDLSIPGSDETALRFLPNGRMVSLVRRTWDDGNVAAIGVSKPPYTEWSFNKTGHFIGGPNFLVLDAATLVGGGRHYLGGDRTTPRTGIGLMTLNSYEPSLLLPSGGDNSYPGFLLHEGLLWTMYYSSHEGKAAIYLAKIRVHK